MFNLRKNKRVNFLILLIFIMNSLNKNMFYPQLNDLILFIKAEIIKIIDIRL
jgi:hypothetical protein